MRPSIFTKPARCIRSILDLRSSTPVLTVTTSWSRFRTTGFAESLSMTRSRSRDWPARPQVSSTQLYTSSLRDIRRTYQRAFKALLFSHRFALSAKPHAGEGSELGYMLARKEKFAGSSCYRAGGPFKIHRADFDFNFLPVRDDYHSPLAQDSRAHPSPQRTQAMFDWWERIFDYDRVRREVRSDCERHLWLLFAEAFEKQPADPGSLLRHMCADARHWPQDLHFFQDQISPIYAVTSDRSRGRPLDGPRVACGPVAAPALAPLHCRGS